nr:C-type lectin domain family 2 member D-like [Chrysemys picta bellii]
MKKEEGPTEQELWLKKHPHCNRDPEEDPRNQNTIVRTQAMERIRDLYRRIRNFIGDRASSTFCKCLRNKVTIPVYGLLIIIVVLVVLVGVSVAALAGALSDPFGSPSCPHNWVGYGGKCYYFSEAGENWNNSQSNCSSFGASLAAIDTPQEMTFLLRCKGKLDHWLGLRREQDQPWKWFNGTKLNDLFEIKGGGHCAYLSDGFVGSSRCSSHTNWICSKHDAYTMGKGTAQPGI